MCATEVCPAMWALANYAKSCRIARSLRLELTTLLGRHDGGRTVKDGGRDARIRNDGGGGEGEVEVCRSYKAHSFDDASAM